MSTATIACGSDVPGNQVRHIQGIAGQLTRRIHSVEGRDIEVGDYHDILPPLRFEAQDAGVYAIALTGILETTGNGHVLIELKCQQGDDIRTTCFMAGQFTREVGIRDLLAVKKGDSVCVSAAGQQLKRPGAERGEPLGRASIKTLRLSATRGPDTEV